MPSKGRTENMSNNTISWSCGHFVVQSHRKGVAPYSVKYSETLGRWMCNCKDWMYRKLYEGGDCKHILEVKGLLETASIEELEQIKRED